MESLAKVPGGMRYYFGEEARLRRAIEATAMEVFDGWGYEEITTPAVDYHLLFERGMGREQASKAFRFTDSDGRLLALRPDVTSSVARAAATLFASRPRPLRLSYSETVFQQRPRSHSEWRRQGRQLGCELIGASEVGADMEALIVTAEVLARLGLAGRYRISINHVGIFKGVAEQLGLDADERERMRRMIDSRAAAELESLLAPHASNGREGAALAGRLARLAGGRETLTEARTLVRNERAGAALDYLGELWDVIVRLGLAGAFEFDLGDVSGLDYYTGFVFKIYAEGAGGRVGGGGRYDELTANFGGREPSVGFVLELDSLMEVLLRCNGGRSDEDVAMTPLSLSGERAGDLFLEATRWRERGGKVRMEWKGFK